MKTMRNAKIAFELQELIDSFNASLDLGILLRDVLELSKQHNVNDLIDEIYNNVEF